jgi:hypothetical protein
MDAAGKATQELPGKFALMSGREATYSAERRWGGQTTLKLQLIWVKGGSRDDFSGIEYTADGKVADFSFRSFSGRSQEEADGELAYIDQCRELLSVEFAAKVAADYQAKKAEFDRLQEVRDGLWNEMNDIETRERETAQAAKAKASRELLNPGQVWVEIGGGTTYRLKVESQSEKSVLFSEWRESGDGKWIEVGDRRVQKRSLGKLTQKSKWSRIGILPMGSTEFGEYPKTNAQLNQLPDYQYAA